MKQNNVGAIILKIQKTFKRAIDVQNLNPGILDEFINYTMSKND